MKKYFNRSLIALDHNSFYISLKYPITNPSKARIHKIFRLLNELSVFDIKLEENKIDYLSDDDIEEFYTTILPKINSRVNPGKAYKPIFSNISTMPENGWYDKISFGLIKVFELRGINEKQFNDIATSLMLSMNHNREDLLKIEWLINNYQNLEIPKNIVSGKVISLLIDSKRDYIPEKLEYILNYIVNKFGYSYYKLINRRKTKKVLRFRNIKRKDRKLILNLLENFISSIYYIHDCDVSRRDIKKWISINKKIHSEDYKNLYPLSNKFFSKLQEDTYRLEHQTWNSKVQEMYDCKQSIKDISRFISTKPEEFVDRFNSLMIRSENSGSEFDVMEVLMDLNINNPSLIKLLNYYETNLFDTGTFYDINGLKYESIPHYTKKSINKNYIDTIKSVLSNKIICNIRNLKKINTYNGKRIYLDKKITDISAIDLWLSLSPKTIYRFKNSENLEFSINGFKITEISGSKLPRCIISCIDSERRQIYQYFSDFNINDKNQEINLLIDLKNIPNLNNQEYILISLVDRDFNGTCFSDFKNLNTSIKDGNSSIGFDIVRKSLKNQVILWLINLKEKEIKVVNKYNNSVSNSNLWVDIEKTYNTQPSLNVFDVLKNYYEDNNILVSDSQDADIIIDYEYVINNYSEIQDILRRIE